MIRTSPRASPPAQSTPQPGSLLESTALIAGTTIGAGILALPAVTQSVGTLPATVALLGTWLYMVASGFLLIEVSANLAPANPQLPADGERHPATDRPSPRGILAMAHQTLGNGGAIVAGLAYSFLHYALLVAYLARGGEILQAAARHTGLFLPPWGGSCIFALGFGSLLFFGSQRSVARLNSLLLFGAIAAFSVLIAFCLPQVVPTRLLVAHWEAIARPIPTLLVALVFHNMLPTVSAQLDGNIPRIRRATLVGSAIPLAMFAIWNAVILGSTEPTALSGAMTFDPLARLTAMGSSSVLSVSILLFSGLAIATSFIGFVYGLLEFYADLWPAGGWRAFLLVLIPPAIFALVIPEAFFAALDYAGIFGITILFGILPAAMAWRQRHMGAALNAATPEEQRSVCPPLLPGARWSLAGVALVAIAIICQQLIARFGAFFSRHA